MSYLEALDLHVSYGAIRAIAGLTLHVEQGEIVALIGGNGAGKTTLLKTISGLLRPGSGEVLFQGSPLSMPPHEIVSLGISHVPEGRRIFPRLTVAENLDMGAYSRRDRAAIEESMQRVFELFPLLKQRLGQAGGTLSGGEQQMLAIGRGLLSQPQVLLLDEPSMGLAPKFVERIFEIVRTINKQGTTVLLVEQNARMALTISQRAYVMESGTLAASGPSEDLLASDQVRKAYLGEV